jgi:septum formation protein
MLNRSFQVKAANIDETPRSREKPRDYVMRMALEKAQTIYTDSDPNASVLAADTICYLDNTILTKPNDFKHAQTMFNKLSGRTHQVYTAIAMVNRVKKDIQLVCTDVTFKTLSEQEIDWYWQTGEPVDKAGAYAIQGLGGQFVTKINGSYSAVVGLPMYETSMMLTSFIPDCQAKCHE